MNAPAAARAYLAKLPPAISGAGGHDATLYAACCLVRLGLSDAEAMTLLREYSRRCQPPWKEAELARKLRDARAKAGGQVRTFTKPKPAVRLVWKVERKPVRTAEPTKGQPPSTPRPGGAEVLPRLTPGGDLVIPFDSPARFHWWEKGMTVAQISLEMEREVIS